MRTTTITACFLTAAFIVPLDVRSSAQPVPSSQPTQQPQPSPLPDPDPTKKLETTIRVVAPSKPGEINNADDLLTLLETSGKDLRSFQASLRKTRFLGELEGNDTQEQGGRIYFITEPQPDKDGNPPQPQPPRRKFKVAFEYSIFNGKVKKDDRTSWIFDGEWLVESDPEAKQIHKRQVVPPGEIMDPLAIGEGPFPLPIGQKKNKILERFEADLLPPNDFKHFQGGQFPKELSQTWQLRLTPRPEFRRDYRLTEIRIWYRQDNRLPRMAWVSNKDGSSEEYFLVSTEENKPLPTGTFDTTTPQGWVEQVDKYRREKPAANADKKE